MATYTVPDSYLKVCNCDHCEEVAVKLRSMGINPDTVEPGQVVHDTTRPNRTAAEEVARQQDDEIQRVRNEIMSQPMNTLGYISTVQFRPSVTLSNGYMWIDETANLARVAEQHTVVLPEIEQLRLSFEARGITPIPDDECTDMGDYVIWNKGTPADSISVRSPSSVIDYIETIASQKRWGHTVDSIMRRRHRAHLTKKVRIVGWFNVDGEYYHYSVRDGLQYQACYNSRGRRHYDSCTGTAGGNYDSEVRSLSLAQVPRSVRRSYAVNLCETLANLGSLRDWRPRRDAIQRLFDSPDMAFTGRTGPDYVQVRGGSYYRGQLLAIRTNLRAIGAMIARPNDTEVSDFVDALNDLDYMPPGMRERMIDKWNERKGCGEEVIMAGCGHVTTCDDSYDVAGDHTVCESCFNENYVLCEDDDRWHHRNNVYRHENDNYYTYREDNYDEDDEGENSVGGRVKGYSDNVLQYAPMDNTITPSCYGDFLMGIELEVVPRHGYRNETVVHTVDNLAKGYAILKNDGSLDNGGFEIVTAPRGLKEHIERFTNWEPHEKLRAWDPGCCGVHVHLSSQAFSQSTLGKFIEFINAKDNNKFIRRIAGRHAAIDGGGAASYCQQEGRVIAANPKATLAGKSTDRYRMVNTQNLGYDEAKRLGLDGHSQGKGINTVELRIFRASLKKGRLLAQIEFAHAAVMFCRWSSMRELREEHFINWLRKAAGVYPNLAKWFGVRSNTQDVVAEPQVTADAEV